MTEASEGTAAVRVLADIRVVDLSTGVAGPLAAMMLADFGAEVVKVEPPSGDPGRSRPGFAMWNRNKRNLTIDPGATPDRLLDLLALADVCVSGGGPGDLAARADAEAACQANPGLVYLEVLPFLGETPWAGGEESAGLLWALVGMALRQSSFDGGPIDPAFPYVLYLQGAWAAASAIAALIERQASGHGQIVTVGGVHAAMVASSASLLIDTEVPEVPASYGPGGPHPMYTRYRCAEGGWLFLATLTTKFQERALAVLGLSDIVEDERIGGRLEAMLAPTNRAWVRQRFVEVFATRTSEEWLATLRDADVPVGPLLRREDWMDSPVLDSIGMRVEVHDPVHGPVTMPGNPINLVATPAELDRPAPSRGDQGEWVQWTPRPAPSRGAPEGCGPLKGFRILDLGTILAGPYVGTLLAELGADVIKVEIPAGDSWRDRGMPYIRGQRGVALDLRSEAGLETFFDLVRSADVVVDNYRAGVLERLKIDYQRLRQVKADIISVSITGFGEHGQYSSEPAFDPLLQARSGMMIAQGGDSEPVLMTAAVNDVTTAALAVLGTLLALFHRLRTGDGQNVWLSLAGTAAFAQCEELISVPGRDAPIVGGRDFAGPGPLDRYYATADGWLRLQAVGRGPGGLREAGLLEGPDPADDTELTERIAAACASLTRDEAIRRLASASVPAAPARRLSELIEDPDYRSWEVFNSLDRPGVGPVMAPGRYVRFSRSQHHETLKPPGVGEHTAEVLAELGFTDDQIDRLAADGVVCLGSPMVFRSMAAYR
jgi:crotonobetainyl-CoA:carnitine CoA-transferase CaiB-like acyl-CoA transferase